MATKGIYLRISEDLLKEVDKLARSMGISRSEAIRLAIQKFIEGSEGETYTHRMRGIVKTSLTHEELEELYHRLR